MKILRSERYAAFLLLGAAVLGVILANTAWGPALQRAKDFPLEIPWLGLHLTVGDWIKDGLLAVFFFVARALAAEAEMRDQAADAVCFPLRPWCPDSGRRRGSGFLRRLAGLLGGRDFLWRPKAARRCFPSDPQ